MKGMPTGPTAIKLHGHRFEMQPIQVRFLSSEYMTFEQISRRTSIKSVHESPRYPWVSEQV
jgi:hypothetical protein